MHAVRVTSPIRTILDVVEEGRLADDLLKQAVSEAASRGLIPFRKLQDARDAQRGRSVSSWIG